MSNSKPPVYPPLIDRQSHPDPLTVAPDTPLENVLAIMRDSPPGRVLAIEGSDIVGFRTEQDVVSFASRQRASDACRGWVSPPDLFQRLLQNSSEVISVCDSIGTLLYASPSSGAGSPRPFGYTPEQHYSRNIFENIHPDDAAKFRNAWEDACKNPGTPLTVEYRYQCKSGNWIWVESAVTNHLEDPAVGGIVVNTRNRRDRFALVEERASGALTPRPHLQRTLDAIFCALPDNIYIFDRDGYCLHCTPTAATTVGMTPDEMRGKTWRQLGFEQAIAQRYERCHEFVLATGQPVTGETTIPSELQVRETSTPSDTGGRHYEYIISPIYGANGFVEAAIHTSRDITELKRLRETLRKSEATNRALKDAIPDMMIHLSKEGTYLDVIPGKDFLPILPVSELIGKQLAEVLPVQVATEAMRAIAKARETHQIQILEYQLPTDNNQCYYEARIVPYGDEEVFAIVRDITDLTSDLNHEFSRLKSEVKSKHTETARGKSEDLYRTLARNFPNGSVVLFDADLRYTIADGAGLPAVGLSKELLEGKTIWEVFPPEICEKIEPVFRSVLAGKTMCYEVPYGNCVYFVHTLPVKNDSGEIFAGMVVVQDITERKQSEVALKLQSERERLIGATLMHIRSSLNLEEILQTTVHQVRRFLQTDRVLIFRFEPNWSGVVEVESADSQWDSMLGNVIYDPCFGEAYAQPYRHGRVSAMEDLYSAGLSQCHIDLLTHFQVRANLVVPILHGSSEADQVGNSVLVVGEQTTTQNPKSQIKSQLWGLLIAHHCSEPRSWQPLEVDLLQQLATQVAIAIQQATLFEQLQTELIERKRAQEQLKASLKEKEVLLKEIHHRVKNNLQVISSLFSLQSLYIQDPQTLEILEDSQNRIQSMALIHEKLYQSKDLNRIDFAEYIQNLAANLFLSYGVRSYLIKLTVNIENIYLNLDTAISCGLIINELVSNSLKHAFPNGRTGEITINFYPEEERFILIISDNGIGLPENLDFRKTESLGLQLVCSLAKQLRCDIEMEQSQGTVFKLIFSELRYQDRV